MNPDPEAPDSVPSLEGGDMIISGGQVHRTEDIPTKNVPEEEMTAFMETRGESPDSRDGDEPEPALQWPSEKNAPAETPAADTPRADVEVPSRPPAGDPPVQKARDSRPRPSSRRQAVGGQGRASTKRAVGAAPPRKRWTPLEKLLIGITIFFFAAGCLIFSLNSKDPEPAPEPEVQRVLSPELKLWLAGEELAATAKQATKAARKLYLTDKPGGSKLYKVAMPKWEVVFETIDPIDFSDPKYAGYQDRMASWMRYYQECVKFQGVDDFDYMEELRRAKEKNRLDEENSGDEEEGE